MASSVAEALFGCARPLFAVATILCLESAHAESWTVSPLLNLSETYSTNMGLTAGAASQGWITDISPGLRIEGRGARVKGNLDYRLDSLRYAGRPELNRNLNALVSAVNVEAVEQWLFLDAGANITQNRAFAFDPAPANAASATTNQSQTTTLRLSPYIRGRLADIAAYQLRFNAIDAHSDSASLVSTRVNQWTGSLKNATAGARLGWFMDGDVSNVRNDIVGSREDARLRAGAIVEVLSGLHLSLSNGRERSTYANLNAQTTSTPGIGVEWAPSSRTQLAAQSEKRFFGTAHSLLLNHRTALTNWRYSDVKDVAVFPGLLSASGQGAVTELMSDLVAAGIPDPVARAAAVRARLDQYGSVSNQIAEDGVQTSRLFVNHAREASAALVGKRGTVTLSLTQRDQQAIGTTSAGIVDSFALSNNIRERGMNASWLHRLTPLTTLNVSAGRLQTEGTNAANLKSTQSTQTISLSFKMDPKTILSLGARSVRFDSTVNGNFRENAVVCALTQRF